MIEQFSKLISSGLHISERQVLNTINLLESGATIPFISRYRKEATSGLDEVQVADIKEALDKLADIAKRKATVLSTIEQQQKLTPELHSAIEQCWDATALEDIYLPYKPKRQTRAEIARKYGLEPLAITLKTQSENATIAHAKSFINKDVKDINQALQGARDIVAEWINQEPSARNIVRSSFELTGVISSKVIKGKEAEGEKYQDLFDYNCPLKRCNSHRLLAMRRGEQQGILRVGISPEQESCLQRLFRRFNSNNSPQMELAIEDSFKRLLKPSIENEFAALSKQKADSEAIKVFVSNLRQLLLAAPLGQKRVMGVDPGFRTGCKVVCLDGQGELLHYEAIFPHLPQGDHSKAASKVAQLVQAYAIEAIAVGNGTASRQTEEFLSNIRYDRKLQIFVVSENGASIYSASKVAREEFPDHDVTVRGAVSIARRLVDPLAELVKIDPKSLGVGQYQHDVDQTALKKSLETTVESCVNLVGVDVNTASKHLLTYISGVGATLAQNIVDYRAANGAFANRRELLKVPRMGNKAYEQSVGFLRITAGQNPLDNSAVHPESYATVDKMARDIGCTVEELINKKELKKSLDLNRYLTDKVGLPTLQDIIEELDKPGRDPRQAIQVMEFDQNVHTLADLHPGMILPAIVNNITNFGCFVDIGIKENGLVHLSEMADKFISSASEVVSLHQHITVRVLSVDTARKRIQLSMKEVAKGN